MYAISDNIGIEPCSVHESNLDMPSVHKVQPLMPLKATELQIFFHSSPTFAD
jgi:hypothetical protein